MKNRRRQDSNSNHTNISKDLDEGIIGTPTEWESDFNFTCDLQPISQPQICATEWSTFSATTTNNNCSIQDISRISSDDDLNSLFIGDSASLNECDSVQLSDLVTMLDNLCSKSDTENIIVREEQKTIDDFSKIITSSEENSGLKFNHTLNQSALDHPKTASDNVNLSVTLDDKNSPYDVHNVNTSTDITGIPETLSTSGQMVFHTSELANSHTTKHFDFSNVTTNPGEKFGVNDTLEPPQTASINVNLSVTAGDKNSPSDAQAFNITTGIPTTLSTPGLARNSCTKKQFDRVDVNNDSYREPISDNSFRTKSTNSVENKEILDESLLRVNCAYSLQQQDDKIINLLKNVCAPSSPQKTVILKVNKKVLDDITELLKKKEVPTSWSFNSQLPKVLTSQVSPSSKTTQKKAGESVINYSRTNVTNVKRRTSLSVAANSNTSRTQCSESSKLPLSNPNSLCEAKQRSLLSIATVIQRNSVRQRSTKCYNKVPPNSNPKSRQSKSRSLKRKNSCLSVEVSHMDLNATHSDNSYHQHPKISRTSDICTENFSTTSSRVSHWLEKKSTSKQFPGYGVQNKHKSSSCSVSEDSGIQSPSSGKSEFSV